MASEIPDGANYTSEDVAELSDDQGLIDITESSNITSIRSDLAQHPAFKALDLSRISLDRTHSSIVLNLNGEVLPPSTELEFRIGDKTFDFSALNKHLSANVATGLKAVPEIKVYLIVKDLTRYALSIAKEALLKIAFTASDYKTVNEIEKRLSRNIAAKSPITLCRQLRLAQKPFLMGLGFPRR